MKKLLGRDHLWIPLLLLGLCIGTYGIFLSQLGFYWDDWMTLFLANKYDTAEKIHNFANRPFFAWMDIILRSILGLKPLNWHILLLILRWLTSWIMWEILVRIWPKYKVRAAWAVILFTVYPTFFKQSFAVTYRSQYIAFLLFFLSLLFMILAYRNEKLRWPYTILGMLATIGHLLTMEYFGGLELLRPLILFLIITPQINPLKQRIRAVFAHWTPYLLMILVFIARRFVFYPGESDPNPIFDFFDGSTVIQSLIDLLVMVLRDVWHMLVTAWSDILHPDLIFDLSFGSLRDWFVAILLSLVVYFVMRGSFPQDSTEEDKTRNRQLLLFGLLSVFLGLLPVWAIGRKVLAGTYADRFGIPAMFGASIFIVTLVSILVTNRNYRQIIFTLMLVVSISAQIRASNNYRWDWIRQTRAYWQIYWRAPAITPGTPIITEGALNSTTNRYNAAFAINFLYPQVEGTDIENYWLFEIPYNGLFRYIPEMQDGMTLTGNYRLKRFIGDSLDSIIVITPESANHCLWFLTPRDINNNSIMEEARYLAPIVNLENIQREPFSADYPNPDIFGQEPKHSWCYYFQKASLAHQFEDWEEIVLLWHEAYDSGFRTSFIYELIPFIEAFAFTGDWDQAVWITKDAYKRGVHRNKLLCTSWKSMQDTFAGDETFDLAFEEVNNVALCQ